MDEFVGFPKIARLSREMVVTEKIDGTNAQVVIEEIPVIDYILREYAKCALILGVQKLENSYLYMMAGSKDRYLIPGKVTDNFGFAAWVKEHAEELFALGKGRHFGEWWGAGIQRKYNQKVRRFSLFNTSRWLYPGAVRTDEKQIYIPPCCDIVPVIYTGMFNTTTVSDMLKLLHENGSWAAPGFMNPEGVVIYHAAANFCFKKTLLKDEAPKGIKA